MENIFTIDNDFYIKLNKLMQITKTAPSTLAVKTKIDKNRIIAFKENKEKPTIQEFIEICYALEREYNLEHILHLIDYELIGIYEEVIRKQIRSKNKD